MRRAIVVVVLALVGCAEGSIDAGGGGLPDDLVEGTGTVLQRAGEPAQLCLGGVRESLPPQCGGVPIPAWDWSAVEGEQEASGVTWGEYHVVGVYDGSTFTVASAGPPRSGPDTGGPVFDAPCPEPAGGWVASDPGRTRERDLDDAIRAAEREPDHTGAWIDDPSEAVGGQAGPAVLVLGFTGDLERHRAEIAAIWGGPLCVVQQDRTMRELRATQDGLDWAAREVGAQMLWSSIDVTTNRVELGVVVTSAALESALADRFGDGSIVVVPALRPVV
jgi:hypothetical protein